MSKLKEQKLRLTEFANGACMALAMNGMLEELQDTWIDFHDGLRDNEVTFDIHIVWDEGKWSAHAYPVSLDKSGFNTTDTLADGIKLKLSCFELLDEMLEE